MEIVSALAALVSLVALAGIIYPFKPFGKRRNALFALIGCIVLVGIAAKPVEKPSEKIANRSARISDGQPIHIPSDKSAEYFVTDLVERTDGLVEISTRRQGSSGTSFAIRLVQCNPLEGGYIAEGDLPGMNKRDPTPDMSPLLYGSISHVIGKYACDNSDVKKPLNAANDKPQKQEEDRSDRRAELEDEVRGAVDVLLWSNARTNFRRLEGANLAEDTFRDEIEKRMLGLVRPLPASERKKNLEGYLFLAAVRPENSVYGAKVKSYEDAIKTERNRAVSRLRKDEDKVEGVTWFQHPNKPKYLNSRSTVYLYIGKKGQAGRPWLRMKVQYTASDWLFVKSVTAWHDGIKEPLASGSFKRDNNSTIWEWVDVIPDDYQIEILRSLANAKETILRFTGDKYHRDVTLSAGDKKAIREVLQAYEIMRSGT